MILDPGVLASVQDDSLLCPKRKACGETLDELSHTIRRVDVRRNHGYYGSGASETDVADTSFQVGQTVRRNAGELFHWAIKYNLAILTQKSIKHNRTLVSIPHKHPHASQSSYSCYQGYSPLYNLKNQLMSLLSARNNTSVRAANNIQVFVRLKPSDTDHDNDPIAQCLQIIDQTSLKVTNLETSTSAPDLQFTFDKVFAQTATQQTIFRTVSENIINNIFEGINGTIFCYGQTASGKTYTCVGPELTGDKRGLLPRIVEVVMEKVSQRPENLDLRVKVCLVQIYNQKVTDLLDLSRCNLKLRQNKKKGVFIEHVSERYISKPEQGNKLLAKGLQNRSVRCSQMNSASSRSHMLFMITVTQSDFCSGEARSAKLTVIDLAGSEKVSKIGSESKLLSEAIKINTSLSALGKVIHALTQNKNSHIPYRDSKLTRLLQEGLGGNSLTSLIVNVSQSSSNLPETICTLRFGNRAKQIKNWPKINKEYTVEQLQELLQKAELKIKAQSKLIQDFSKNKKDTDGRMSVGKPLTLHIIDYEDETDSNADAASDLSLPVQKKSKSAIKRTSVKESARNMSASKATLKSQRALSIDVNIETLINSLKYIPIQKMTPRFQDNKPNVDNAENITSNIQQKPQAVAFRSQWTKTKTEHQIFLEEQNEFLKENLESVQNENRAMSNQLTLVMTSLQRYKKEAKISEEIIEKNKATIQKLKCKSHQRKTEIISQIQSMKDFWQTFYRNEQENQSLHKQPKQTTQANRSALQEHNFNQAHNNYQA